MKIDSRNVFPLALFLSALFLHSSNSRADTVYVWSNDGTVQKFTENGVASPVTNNISSWNGPVGLALDNVGNLYTGCPGDSSIRKFSPEGIGSLVGYNIDSVSGLAFDNAGNLFVTIPNYFEITKLNYFLGYGYALNGPYTQSQLSYPITLAFDTAGNFYTVNNTNAIPFFYFGWPTSDANTIEKFSANFTDLGAFATNLNNPWGLAFDNKGNLYVANSGTNGILQNTIVKFTTNGVRSTFALSSAGLNNPQGLAFDSTGNLYVANSGNGTVVKFAPNGTGSVFASGLNSPSSIAIFPGLKLWSATTLKLNNQKSLPDGAFQFGVTENPGLTFTVLASTNVSLPFTNWTSLGGVTEISPGIYQFTDQQAANNPQRFYQIRSP